MEEPEGGSSSGMNYMNSTDHMMINQQPQQPEYMEGLEAQMALMRAGNQMGMGGLPNSTPWGVNPTGFGQLPPCLLYTSPSPRDRTRSRMPSSA